LNLKRWLWILVVGAVVVAAIVFGYRKQPVAVELTEVKHGPLRITVEEEGKTRIVNRYVVSAPVTGYAERIRLKVGDPVAAGQVVCWIAPPPAPVLDARSRAEQEARVEAAEAAVRVAEERAQAAAADESYAIGQAERMKKLLASGDIAREAADRAESEERRTKAARQSALAAIEQARSEVAAARAALRESSLPAQGNPGRRIEVRAPTAGRVLTVNHESEGPVVPGQALLEIGNARSLEVEVEVLSADAVRIEQGMRVMFERWGGAQPLEGRVRRVEPVAFTKISALGVEEQRVLILVAITSPESEWRRLGDRYRVEASFILWEADSVLQVPASALFRHGEGWAVFVVEEKFARRRAVEVGRRNARFGQIVSGLREGETVIVHPDDTVVEGVEVTARR
jgi:HlyD family secretion protein